MIIAYRTTLKDPTTGKPKFLGMGKNGRRGTVVNIDVTGVCTVKLDDTQRAVLRYWGSRGIEPLTLLDRIAEELWGQDKV